MATVTHAVPAIGKNRYLPTLLMTRPLTIEESSTPASSA